MKSNRFYLSSLRDSVGGNVSFHCKDGRGYHTDVRKAHVYTRQEAQRAWDFGRDFDLPLCADQVDALSVWHVDCQLVECDSVILDDCQSYVAYRKSKWNGNDLYWLMSDGNFDNDFKKATTLCRPTNDQSLVFIPFHLADSVKRPTFSVRLINRRKMTQAAGILIPNHVKRQQRRSSKGLTRFNCPSCGKINWQANPYEFERCSDASCHHSNYY